MKFVSLDRVGKLYDAVNKTAPQHGDWRSSAGAAIMHIVSANTDDNPQQCDLLDQEHRVIDLLLA